MSKIYLEDIKKQYKDYPCDGCQICSGSYTGGRDEKGEYIEITS
jgi:hypothetical protein